jgi:two-component system, NarL family, response regulator NreC
MEEIKIRIIIVDDHPMFREGIKIAVNLFSFATVTGEANNGKVLLEMLKNTECDIILMDIRMPIMDGLEASKIILEKYPHLKIIIFTAVEDEDNLHEMLAAGVKGFILKNIEQDEFEVALKEVYNDNVYLSKKFQTIVYNFYINSRVTKFHLTNKEIEFLTLFMKDLSNPEIARKLYRTVRTVEGHKNNLLRKTKCKNSYDLKVFAINNNLINNKS